MASNTMFLSRDFFYAALFCLGLGLGLVSYLAGPRLTLKQRNRIISIAILWASGSVIFLALAVVYSRGEVFFRTGFLVAGGLIFIPAILGCRFPRAVGFPILILGGIGIVVFSSVFLRFPEQRGNGADPVFIRFEGSNRALVRVLNKSGADKQDEYASFDLLNARDPLIADIIVIRLDEAVPFAGGQVRVSPEAVYQDDTLLFENPHTRLGIFRELPGGGKTYPLISLEKHTRIFNLNTLP